MKKKKKKKKTKKKGAKRKPAAKTGPACELCGKRGRVMRTECCGHVVCDDEDNYVMFSYARTSCARNHRRYTLCGYHFAERHHDRWQQCEKCLEGFEPEMVAWFGTNEFNFDKLENPPTFEPTLCSKCGRRIDLGNDGYSTKGGEYYCERCTSSLLGHGR